MHGEGPQRPEKEATTPHLRDTQNSGNRGKTRYTTPSLSPDRPAADKENGNPRSQQVPEPLVPQRGVREQNINSLDRSTYAIVDEETHVLLEWLIDQMCLENARSAPAEDTSPPRLVESFTSEAPLKQSSTVGRAEELRRRVLAARQAARSNRSARSTNPSETSVPTSDEPKPAQSTNNESVGTTSTLQNSPVTDGNPAVEEMSLSNGQTDAEASSIKNRTSISCILNPESPNSMAPGAHIARSSTGHPLPRNPFGVSPNTVPLKDTTRTAVPQSFIRACEGREKESAGTIQGQYIGKFAPKEAMGFSSAAVHSRYFEDLDEWLHITGYHDESYRQITLRRHRALSELEKQKVNVLMEFHEDNPGYVTGPRMLAGNQMQPPRQLQAVGTGEHYYGITSTPPNNDRVCLSNNKRLLSPGTYDDHRNKRASPRFSDVSEQLSIRGPDSYDYMRGGRLPHQRIFDRGISPSPREGFRHSSRFIGLPSDDLMAPSRRLSLDRHRAAPEPERTVITDSSPSRAGHAIREMLTPRRPSRDSYRPAKRGQYQSRR